MLQCLRTLVGHTGGVWSSQMSENVVISGSTDRTLKVWNADTGQCTHTLYGHTSTVRCMHLYNNTSVLTAFWQSFVKSKVIEVLDLELQAEKVSIPWVLWLWWWELTGTTCLPIKISSCVLWFVTFVASNVLHVTKCCPLCNYYIHVYWMHKFSTCQTKLLSVY